jgi:hypothetical protein
MRVLASALKVRFRSELADKRFNDALITAKTTFALARHCSDHPTLVGNFVAIAIAGHAADPLEEMIQQPGSPNLFWALTYLPRPFIDNRKGLQGESMLFSNEFDRIDEKAVMSEAAVENVVERFDKLIQVSRFDKLIQTGPKESRLGPRKWVEKHVTDMAYLQAARKRLIESGLDKNKVNQFTASQLVLVEGKFAYEVVRDEGLRAMMLPYWQAEPLLALHESNAVKEQSPFTLLAASYKRILEAQTGLERQFALVRCVEALRLYAAENNGKLPAQLADIKLPLPVDPYTGKAFPYELKGDTATLRFTPPPGMEKSNVHNVRYEISIAK